VLYTADANAQAEDNIISSGVFSSTIEFTFDNASGGGRYNQLLTTRNGYFNLTGTEAYAFKNTGSNVNPIHTFYNSSVEIENATSTEWSVQNGASNLIGKQNTDTEPRIQIDYANGRTYYGNGSTAKASLPYFSLGGSNKITNNGDFEVTGDVLATNIDVSGELSVSTPTNSYLNFTRNDSSISSGNQLGDIRYYGDDPSAGNQGASFKAQASGGWTASNYPTEFVWSSDSSGVLTEKLKLTSNGNLQIELGSLIIASSGEGIEFSSGPVWTVGAGTPEGNVTADVGSLYTRTDGGAGTTLYVKESGTGNTGWVAK